MHLNLNTKNSDIIANCNYFVTKIGVIRHHYEHDYKNHQPGMQKQEFLNIVIPIKDKLYRMAKRILISHDEAEDAVQEVFMKLWSGREKIKNYSKPEAFAMTMTKNYCLDRLKSKQATNLTIVHQNYKSNDARTEDQVEARDGVGMVFEIMKQLPEQQRIILQLRDVEEYEYSEIAEIMEMNETAIRVNLSRARKLVREELIKKYNYGLTKN
ncbi:DNA-directed RNA polymerase sigma-70 factor [Planktosalinus lacus]|uniref:DNA-directed RNA polymerase sigma-70 factor n=2 Tax=Planktosalinus lacus TaxID=1526573 RepID=A0A8J2VAX9_9FLAO|nr:DNA-directed RNA polymerase sigma-70 factor [Planktosalinus lacus]